MASGKRAKRAKRRRNHGAAIQAGSLAWDTIGFRLSRPRIRMVRLRLVWDEIAPGAAGTNLWPHSMKDDELVLLASSSQWLHELTYLQDDLLRRIQERCPEAEVSRIRARVGQIQRPRLRPLPPLPPRARGNVLAPEPSPDTLDAIEGVRDPDLRQAIASARLALSRW